MNPSSAPRRSATALWYVGGTIVLAGLFALGLAPKLQHSSQLASETRAETTAPTEVVLAHPRLATDDLVLLPGDVQAIEETSLQARATGYVSKMYVDIGSHVKAGQLLAEIDSPDADLQVAQARADQARSVATVGQSMADAARSHAGVSQSQADLAHQEAGVQQAQAALIGSQAKLAAAQAAESQAEAVLAQANQGVASQNAALGQQKAQYELAEANEKRYRTLLAQAFVSQQDYDTAAATYKSAAANISAAEANVKAAEAQVKADQQAISAAQSAIKSAEADVRSADANLTAAKAAYDSQKSVLSAARFGAQSSEMVVNANKYAVSSSAANTQRLDVLKSFERVTAPFDGVITSRNVDVGSLVSPGATSTTTSATTAVGLFGIARVDTLRIYVSVPQSDYRSIHPGMSARVLVKEVPNMIFTGTVYQASGALDPSTRTLQTEIRLPNPTGILKPGMFAQVEFDAASRTQELRAPSSTVTFDAKGTRVAIVDSSNHAQFVPVVVGKDFGTEVEIVKGVNVGDRLIANPPDELKDGDEVKIVSSGS